jgi:hypothetical protein
MQPRTSKIFLETVIRLLKLTMHPGADLIGVVHNALLLDDPERTVVIAVSGIGPVGQEWMEPSQPVLRRVSHATAGSDYRIMDTGAAMPRR